MEIYVVENKTKRERERRGRGERGGHSQVKSKRENESLV